MIPNRISDLFSSSFFSLFLISCGCECTPKFNFYNIPIRYIESLNFFIYSDCHIGEICLSSKLWDTHHWFIDKIIVQSQPSVNSNFDSYHINWCNVHSGFWFIEKNLPQGEGGGRSRRQVFCSMQYRALQEKWERVSAFSCASGITGILG